MYYVLPVPARRAIGHAAWICGVTAVAGSITAANRAGWIRITDLAATPKAVGDGRLWLLLASGLVAFALGVAVAASWPSVEGSSREASARSDTRGGAAADSGGDGDATAEHGDGRRLAPVGGRVRHGLGSHLRADAPRLRRLRRRL